MSGRDHRRGHRLCRDRQPEILEARQLFAQKLRASTKKEIAAEAEQVREAGGLFIMGTERHESRRIDNQLRGRPAVRATPARPGSSSPWRTTSCVCSAASGCRA